MDFQTNQVKFVSYDIKYFFYMTIYICYVLRITEEEKIEGAVDVSESVYYLHNLSTPIVHQHIATRLFILLLICTLPLTSFSNLFLPKLYFRNILVDGKTLRFRLRAPEIQVQLFIEFFKIFNCFHCLHQNYL